MVPRKHPIVVREMSLNDFFDFKSLLQSHYQHRKINTNGDPVLWTKIRFIQYRHDSPGLMFYKSSFDSTTEFESLDLRRKKTRNSQPAMSKLALLSTKPLGIPENKLIHLQELQAYIDENSRLLQSIFKCTNCLTNSF